MSIEQVLDQLRRFAVIGVVRSHTTGDALAIAHELLSGGIQAIEITYTVPDADVVVAELATHTDGLIGAGTIVSHEQLTSAINAGARFVVSPVNPPFMIDQAHRAGVVAVPGCATPTEMWAATGAGAMVVKMFPAGRLGGTDYLRDLAGPLPNLRIMPSGGVTIDEIPAYLDAGAWCVGIGSPLAGDIPSNERIDRARRASAHAQH